jgi:signal transduction histidine kinase
MIAFIIGVETVISGMTDEILTPMIQNSRITESTTIESIREFQERLKVLHEVSIALTRASSVDEICRMGVELGRSKLEFDRLGIWLIEGDPPFFRGTFGTDEDGQTRDERDIRAALESDETAVKAIRDHTVLSFEEDCALYSHHMEVVGRGWNALAMLWDGDQCIGWISADNLLRHHPATYHDLEILRLYGSTIGHLCVQQRVKENLLEERLKAALHKEKVELLTSFISTLSHDLKNPLTVIKTNLYLMERLNDPAREKAKLQVIKEQTSRLEKLIEDVLTMSRLEHGTQFSFEPVDLNTLLDEARQKIETEAVKKNLVVRLDRTASLPMVNVIKGELHRAVVNLLENAVNYTPPGGSITLRTRMNDTGVAVEVIDTGIGIGKDDLPYIFDRFYRADAARTSGSGGTGLGLAIVKKIVEMHDGAIEVESRPGEGSCFRITLTNTTRL